MYGVVDEPFRLEWMSSFKPFYYDCTKCSKLCCGVYSVFINESDKTRMEGRLGGVSEYVDLDGDRFKLKKREDRSCMFQDENGLCSIHDFSPDVCQIFPIVCDFSSDGRIRVERTILCPDSKSGLKVDGVYLSEYIKRRVGLYAEYYWSTQKYYVNLTESMLSKHPLIGDLQRVECLVEQALRESLQHGFNQSSIFHHIAKLSHLNAFELKSVELGNTRVSDHFDHGKEFTEWDPFKYIAHIFTGGQNILVFDKNRKGFLKHTTVYSKEGEWVLSDSQAVKTEVLKDKLDFNKRTKDYFLEYLIEVLKRPASSQNLIKNLSSQPSASIFKCMADLMFYYSSTITIYYSILKQYYGERNLDGKLAYNTVASVDYGPKKQVYDFLSTASS